MYKKVQTDMRFAERELDVLKLWEENDIVNKSLKLREGNESFCFYDGPPTANGKPHIGHVLTRAIKDLIPRYQTMKGKSVLRIAGWDTHGLPVELEVEKKLGISGKPEIEKYGIEPFIKECKKSVWTYLSQWKEMSERIGYWVDMENPYVTYHDNYIESVWWSLKEADKQGLLYKGHKIVPFCPRCGTALSSHEVAQGYKELNEFSAYVRFKVKGEENLYILAWTTTPWTLPSNVALCVNDDFDYAYFKLDDKKFIMAKELIPSMFSEDEQARIEIYKLVKGRELVGLEYEPLYSFGSFKEKGWYIVSDGYVSLSDGTGIVHIAPAFGEDDSRVGVNYNLPFVQLVNTQGRFISGTPWEGVFVKDADELIFEDLNKRGLLQAKLKYLHNYPHCWRCDTPLIYYARGGWFLRSTERREELLNNNRSVNWYPENIKEGRMGNFLENVIDWALSRERYWGTPLPVWVCECGHKHVVGSKQELYDMAYEPFELPELHRPYIDNVYLKCEKCGGKMHRVKEVIDCWYDSGSMPFAQWHYPFENKENFENNFPADFISEAIDQTRGWFYSTLAISTFVFNKAPYKNCLVLGHVQDKDGRKMSKHLGNVVSPNEVIEKHGADAVRWYFYSNSAPWLPSRFYDEAVAEGARKFMSTLWNTYAFYILYADIDEFVPNEHKIENVQLSLMDRWILSKLNSTIRIVDEELSNYHIPEAANALVELVDELSNWYVRRGRQRFWGKGMEGDKEAAFATLFHVLKNICLLTAPFTPFIAEEIYQNIVRTCDKTAPESVHLCDFPVCDETKIDKNMESQMETLLSIVQLGRAARNLSNVKVRQPLSRLIVAGASLDKLYAELAEDELNVKSIEFTNDASEFVSYKLKPQLKTLGPRYGKLLGQISKALSEFDGTKAVRSFNNGENIVLSLESGEVELSKDDVLIESQQKQGLCSQEGKGISVALDTSLTHELLLEGYAREIISKLQTMRKEADFNVTDRIAVSIEGNELIKEAVLAHFDMICEIVLASSLTTERLSSFTESKEWDINDKKAVLTISKA